MSEGLELAEMISALRAELNRAQGDGADEPIRFTVEDVELELSIAVENKVGGKVGAKFFVLTSEVGGEARDTVTQKIKLKLKPELTQPDGPGGEPTGPVRVKGEVDR